MEMLGRVIPMPAGCQADDTYWWLQFQDITTASELRSQLQNRGYLTNPHTPLQRLESLRRDMNVVYFRTTISPSSN